MNYLLLQVMTFSLRSQHQNQKKLLYRGGMIHPISKFCLCIGFFKKLYSILFTCVNSITSNQIKSNQITSKIKLSFKKNSFSDWKIRIKIQNNRSKKEVDEYSPDDSFVDRTYNVHRNILAIGERRSGYFANLLHYGIDDGNSRSDIELSSRAATYFPDLLDFMYSSKAFDITTRNAIALLFLSQAFQVVSLETQVEKFIHEDIKLYNFGYYMSDALYFSDETIALKVIDTCEKEAMLLFNSPNNRALSSILNVPILSSVLKVEEKCKDIWSFLTQEKRSLQGQIFAKLQVLRRKDSH
jgi:hypothetical protein